MLVLECLSAVFDIVSHRNLQENLAAHSLNVCTLSLAQKLAGWLDPECDGTWCCIQLAASHQWGPRRLSTGASPV